MDAYLFLFSLLSLAANSIEWRAYDPRPQAGPAPAPLTTTTPLAESVLPLARQVEVPVEDPWVWYLWMPLLGLLFLALAWDLVAARPSAPASSSSTRHASCQTPAGQGVDAGVQCKIVTLAAVAPPVLSASPLSVVSSAPRAPVLGLSKVQVICSLAPSPPVASTPGPLSPPPAPSVLRASPISSVSLAPLAPVLAPSQVQVVLSLAPSSPVASPRAPSPPASAAAAPSPAPPATTTTYRNAHHGGAFSLFPVADRNPSPSPSRAALPPAPPSGAFSFSAASACDFSAGDALLAAPAAAPAAFVATPAGVRDPYHTTGAVPVRVDAAALGRPVARMRRRHGGGPAAAE